jgi:hypothetical protein
VSVYGMGTGTEAAGNQDASGWGHWGGPPMDVDMHTMPIRSESNQIKHHKTKRSKMCEGPGQPVLLGPPKCKCNMKYYEIRQNMICARCPIHSARLSEFV